MNEPDQLDVIDMLRAFLSHHPTMRFGQAVCGITAWENDDPNQASDEMLAALLKQHLEANFGPDAYCTENSSMSAELVTAIRNIRRLEPLTPLAQLISRLAMETNKNLYDIENDEVLTAVRIDIAAVTDRFNLDECRRRLVEERGQGVPLAVVRERLQARESK